MPKETVVSTLSFTEGAKVLTIEIPLPPHACSPNVKGHVHWRVSHAAAKEHRSQIAHTFKGMFRGHVPSKVTISTEWFMGLTTRERAAKQAKAQGAKAKDIKKLAQARYRPNDIQNANSSLKAAIDGLCDAGMAPDDNHKWVDWGTTVLYRTEKEHKGRSCVVIRLEFADPFRDGLDPIEMEGTDGR